MLPPLYAYNEQVYEFRNSQQLQIGEYCNGFLAVNKGNAPVIINGFPLLPPPAAGVSGESVGLIGNLGEIYVGNNGTIQIVFDLTGAPSNPLVVIVLKYYIPQYKNLQ